MKYKTYNCNSYNIHTIKTDKFKTCHLEIVFRKKALKKDFASHNLLVDLLTESSKKYPTKKEMILHLEDLYKAYFYGTTSRTGNVLNSNLVYEFINPKYIEEDNYFEEVLSFPFETLLNPNVTNDEFDTKLFDLRKKRLELDIKSLDENGLRLSIFKALQYMDKDSIAASRTVGSLKDLETITPSTLYKTYKDLFKQNVCDIFLIGDLDMDKAVKIIKKHFYQPIINNKKLELSIVNKINKKEIIKKEIGPFLQSNVVLVYNMVDLTKYEKDIVLHVYNYILGSGGLTSKLYQEVREKKSYCYAIESIPMKHDNLMIIHVSLDNDNTKEAIKIIKKTVKDLKVDENDLNIAKTNLTTALVYNLDNPVSLINNYAFKVFDDLPDIEKRLEMIKDVTINDVMNLSKKLRINTTFILEGDSDA